MNPRRNASSFQGLCPRFAKGKLVPIVLISESLLRRSTVNDGRLLRDSVLMDSVRSSDAQPRFR
jgi:hypothetical protein